jgi:rhodanese-related sulfurtransferase
VQVLSDGIGAWRAAGGMLFSGVNVPSKAFGEWVEHHYGTESVDAPELDAWIKSGRKMVVLDSRTVEEYRRMSIPTGISMPGGELAYRIGDIAPDPETLVVVNCAGRTRSILGAESLRQAGIPNPVVALRNGTMGWELAGLTCERGREAQFRPGKPATAALARQRAEAFASRSGVRVIDRSRLASFRADRGRTLYMLDVRDPVEFAAGAVPGSHNAPGGQLIQATDNWIGVRGARIVLIDDDGVRARMAAAWLRQMGHANVFVVDGALADAAPPPKPAPPPDVPTARTIPKGAVVIDLARSIDFREGHIPGAIWGLRTRLNAHAAVLKAAKEVVITSPDGVLAAMAVAEAQALTEGRVRALAGGTRAWKGPLEQNRLIPSDAECIDVHLRAYDRNSGVESAMRAYLSWEVALVNQIARDPSIRFGV